MDVFASVSSEELERFRSRFSKEIAFINQTADEIPNHVWEIPNSGGVYKVDEDWFDSKIDAVDCATFLHFQIYCYAYAPGDSTIFKTVARCHFRDTTTVS